MRVLVVSEHGGGLDIVWRLQRENHAVTFYVKHPNDIGKGIASIVHTLPRLSQFDLAICLGRNFCDIPERAECPVLGPTKSDSKMELDRAFGMRLMEAHGIETPPWKLFFEIAEARKFAEGYGKPLVFKPNGVKAPPALTIIGEEKDNSDLIPLLDIAIRQCPEIGKEGFLLQEKIDGIEISAGSYFNGLSWAQPIMVNFENKKLAPKPWAGPVTGEMGSFCFYGYSPKLFREVTEKMTPYLREITYKGDFDVNCIVTKQGPLALEMTPRIGFPAICLQMENCGADFGEFLWAVASGNISHYNPVDKWVVGVVLTCPPYPYDGMVKDPEQFKGLPIHGEFTDHIYPIDVYQEGEKYYSSGEGRVAVACGVGPALRDAQEVAYKRLKTLKIPNMLARADIGDRFFAEKAELQEGGWLS